MTAPYVRRRKKLVSSYRVYHRPVRGTGCAVGVASFFGGRVTFLKGQERQRTIRREARIEGVGLHGGVEARVVIRPADSDCGVVFRRSDLSGDNVIKASPANVVASYHGTTLANGAGASVATVEHLMAALALVGIDNAEIDVDGPEIPILDGSAAGFVEAIGEAGQRSLAAPRRFLALTAPLTVADGARVIAFEPGGPRELEIEIEFDNCMIGRQSLVLSLEAPTDIARLVGARTFCRASDVDLLRRAGLIRGGSLENSLVVDGDRLLNETPLRDPAEFALHKALDLVGDLWLAGAPFNGRIRALRPGHDLNVRAAAALAAQAARLGDAAPVRVSA